MTRSIGTSVEESFVGNLSSWQDDDVLKYGGAVRGQKDVAWIFPGGTERKRP